MAEKITVARIKKFGKTFEISIDSDKALKYKNGEITDLREILLADNIFSDAKRGLIAPQNDLQQAFQTISTDQIADIILKQGEVQVTAEHRSQEREQKKRKLIDFIRRQAVDPATGFPHPAARIEAALEEAKVHLDNHKTVEEQINDVVTKIRPILPIKIEQKQITIAVPAAYTGKAYSVVKSTTKILQENWQTDGSWKVKVELPAGLYQEFLDKLNSITHGEVRVEEILKINQ